MISAHAAKVRRTVAAKGTAREPPRRTFFPMPAAEPLGREFPHDHIDCDS